MLNKKSDTPKSIETEEITTFETNLMGLRIVDMAREQAMKYVDIAVTPQALVYLHSSGNKHYLKPVDFLKPQEIFAIKRWVVEAVMAMDAEWQKYGVAPLELFKAIGTDLCILLETLKVTDLIITRIWETNKFTHILVNPVRHLPTNMLQYEFPGYQYTDLLNDDSWVNKKKIKVLKDQTDFPKPKYMNKNAFNPPYWKKVIRFLLNVYRASQKLKINLFSIVLIKIGIKRSPIPSLFLFANKDTSEMLHYQNSVLIEDYLALLPEEPQKINELQSELINSLENWFNRNTPTIQNIGMFKNIIRTRITAFIGARRDLLSAYIKIHSLNSPGSLKLLLPVSIGCSSDAWCSMAVKEKGGVDASGQHGGGHNSFTPYSVFAEARYSFYFSYGDVSPTYEFLAKHGKAKYVKTGSPTLYSVQQKCGVSPQKVSKILYIMNLCVPFYSANFPWEFVLKQFKVLELLNSYSDEYTIHIKEEHTGTVQKNNYPGLSFIDLSPKEVMHQYDLLIVESGQSTAVLEATVTNKYIIAYTGFDWEDLSKESLDMLSKRAECFHNYDDFLIGLKKILDDPQTHLDSSKLTSGDFMNTYCNPVSPERYIETIKKTLELS